MSDTVEKASGAPPLVDGDFNNPFSHIQPNDRVRFDGQSEVYRVVGHVQWEVQEGGEPLPVFIVALNYEIDRDDSVEGRRVPAWKLRAGDVETSLRWEGRRMLSVDQLAQRLKRVCL